MFDKCQNNCLFLPVPVVLSQLCLSQHISCVLYPRLLLPQLFDDNSFIVTATGIFTFYVKFVVHQKYKEIYDSFAFEHFENAWSQESQVTSRALR